MDCPNLEFEYGDADGHGAELAGEAVFGCCAVIYRCPAGRENKNPAGMGDGY